MTRAQIRHAARVLAKATDWDDPDSEDMFLRVATRRTSADLEDEYLQWTANVVEGQATYCLPGAYYLESAECRYTADADDYPTPLAIVTPREMSSVPFWRTDGGTTLGEDPAANTSPQVLVVESLSSFTLYPTPALSVTNGLTLRGFGWITDAMWATDASTCPLTEVAQDALIYRFASMIAKHRGDRPLAADLEQEYRRERNGIEIKRTTMSEAVRMRYTGMGGTAYPPEYPF